MQARSRLYGRRIKGDIGPINIDPRTRLPGAILAPAVSLTGAEQYYDQQSAVPNFTLGSRMVVDERTFHYAKAGAPLIPPCTYRLSVDCDLNAATTWDMPIQAVTLINATQINVTHGNYGIVATTVAVNELVNGWIEIFGSPLTNVMAHRRIIANTGSVLGDPAFITITVDRPIDFAIPALGAGITVALHRSPYNNVQMAGVYPTFESANGLAPIAVTNGNYFWLQTWGHCFIAAQINSPGFSANFRDVYLGPAGTIISFDDAFATGVDISPQRIGYVIGASTNADGNNDIMLQLAP